MDNGHVHGHSAIGLIPILQTMNRPIVGCEVGVAFGTTFIYTLDNVPGIEKMYAVDPHAHPTLTSPEDLVEWATVKKIFIANCEPYKNKVIFIDKTSDEAKDMIPDNSLDYIFIDGDHSYEAVYKDIRNYYPKMKSGSIFAGHDYNWEGVIKAVNEFMDELRISRSLLYNCANDCWYWKKP